MTPKPRRLLCEMRGLTRQEAADYIGLGTTKFDELVELGKMPKPKRIGARRIWDRWELDAAFSALQFFDQNAGAEAEVDHLDDTWADIDEQLAGHHDQKTALR